jgi:hypothetical protein
MRACGFSYEVATVTQRPKVASITLIKFRVLVNRVPIVASVIRGMSRSMRWVEVLEEEEGASIRRAGGQVGR